MPISPKQQQTGQKSIAGQKPSNSGKPGLGQDTELPEKTPPPNQTNPQTSQDGQSKEKEKKTPAQEKDDSLKYEMQYVNGGFNNGVQIKPDKNGKANVEISIYGGGEKKTLTVGPLPADISKLIKAYEIATTQNSDSPEITGELQKYFAEVNERLSRQIISILQETDIKVFQAIKSTFKELKWQQDKNN